MNYKTLSEISNLWTAVLKEIQKEVDPMVFKTFFKDSYIDSIVLNNVTVITTSNFACSVLSQQYSDIILKILEKLTNNRFSISFITSTENKNSGENTDIFEQKDEFFANSIVDPNLNFDNFVHGESNNEAYQASVIVSSKPGEFYNPLFIYGGSGFGKTHLLNAIGNYIKEKNPKKKILYVTAQDFVYQYVSFVSSNTKGENLSKAIKKYDVLLLDDIQMLKDKKATLEFFFDIYQFFIQNKKQIVLASDRLPNELEGIDVRLVTRFMNGLTVKVSSPTDQMWHDILLNKLKYLKLDINMFDTDAIDFIASNFKTSVRELNGALNKLLFARDIQGITHFTYEKTYECLGGIVSSKQKNIIISPKRILNHVADYYGLSVDQLTSKSRKGNIVFARNIAMYLMRNMLNVSLKEIGTIFGGRDHSTVINSITNIENLLKTDDQVKGVIEALKKKIHGQKD